MVKFHPMTNKGMFWILGGILVIILAATMASYQSARQPPVQNSINYNSTRICPDAFNEDLDYSKKHVRYFDVTLREGCFGAFVHIPHDWQMWESQPVGDASGFWYAVWIANEIRARGPFGANDHTNLSYTITRLQGHGTVRFYTNSAVPTDRETSDPAATSAAYPGYQKRFCEERHPVVMGDSGLKVELHEGCFSGPVTTPGLWEEDKSQNEGDWAAMWCEGRTQPSAIHPYTEDFAHDEVQRCGKIYLQGKGSILFTKLR